MIYLYALFLEFDKQNITSSLKRKLDKNLLLLVQQKVGNSHYWIPPQGIRKEGETMRQVCLQFFFILVFYM